MNKKEVKAWIKEHKCLFIGVGVGTVCIAGAIIGIKFIPKRDIGIVGKENAKLIDEQIFTVLAPKLEDMLLHESGDFGVGFDLILDNGIKKTVDVIVKES